ncbi:hypothetical protein OXX59_004232, partial [Metschnikowia pulcherrima]
VGNYGVPDRELKCDIVEQLPKYFESNRIHIAGLVVAHYTEEYSHFFGQVVKLRDNGSTLGRLSIQKTASSHDEVLGQQDWQQYFDVPEWDDPNVKNLVAKVSTKEPVLYKPQSNVKTDKNGKPIRIVAVDVGMKYNQIRCFVARGVELKVVPWDYDFTTEEYDGLFISNGPGDPQVMTETVARLEAVMKEGKTPVFGICLGHQLLARATGADTVKLKFGNRGHNIPCT